MTLVAILQLYIIVGNSPRGVGAGEAEAIVSGILHEPRRVNIRSLDAGQMVCDDSLGSPTLTFKVSPLRGRSLSSSWVEPE